MEYHYVAPGEDSAGYLAETLTRHLRAGERVVWLLSGGSAIGTAISAAKKLEGVDCSHLEVGLVDERYGAVGHPDENWQQLLDGGFAIAGATLYRPLQGLGKQATTEAFGAWLQTHINNADYRIGLFGVGTDGHTGGIKPHSPAVSALGWATIYTHSDFERLTMTFEAIRHLDEVVVQMIGPDKAPVAQQLLHDDIPLDDQPAQVLKLVKKSTLYTDYKEGSV